MSSPIGFREFSEDEYRKSIRTLSNEELIKAGKRLRILCGDVVTPTPSTFDRQLKIGADIRNDAEAYPLENYMLLCIASDAE